MPSTLLNITVLFLAVAAGVYQLYLKPILTTFGYQRQIQSIGNKNCQTVPELKACEKLVIHQPTGVVYLACSNQASRTFWVPAVGRLNETAASRDDYVATYDPKTSRITRLKLQNFNSKRGLSLHGMDVVPSSSNPEHLYVYLVNHRAPSGGQAAKLVGADSVMEIFETQVGSSVLTHLKTVEDPTIITPNDVIGYGDGKTFYVTNDHGEKTGLLRELDIFGRASTSVVYCNTDVGCKFAITHMHGNNGIAKASNDTIYVANSIGGGMYILERQRDNSLIVAEYIKTDRCLDNLSVDSNGAVWAAGLTDAITLIFKHFADPSHPAPSSALRFTINTGPAAFYGEKYKIDKIFEDDGSLASGVTSVAYDAERKKLFLHGLVSPHMVICKL
ncbi:hypothetical protein AMATHDRAFT_4627 [Amanita thiersii Skay4041]|uniref:SMP-30/Gluconolactonase/LRE-like region domain-containing protein n=1 Tax=Amanita thiersii Skay4041 TaxID=703135 RepID=A0A2A9NQ12_9AGAR|nr:hypothetical protein AMATHDRAFT_4627 [Amanita thiersii Skay4041]